MKKEDNSNLEYDEVYLSKYPMRKPKWNIFAIVFSGILLTIIIILLLVLYL